MCAFKPEILYSDMGGVFIGKNIQSSYQTNRLISIIISFQNDFLITQFQKDPVRTPAALISPNIKFKIHTEPETLVAFIHMDPYSETDLRVKENKNIAILPADLFQDPIQELQQWISSAKVANHPTDSFLRKVIQTLPDNFLQQKQIDERILKCIETINRSDSIRFEMLAQSASLSVSRLSHLFKEETNITLKQYIQHRKMIRSIHGLHQKLSFSDAAFHGGFSDQPHFIKIFKKMFGIIPSKTRQ